MPNAILVGKEETFKSLGLSADKKVNLELLINRIKRQFEQEYYDCQEVGADVLEGLQAVKEGKVDHRHWKKVLNEL
jgi:hypothetical protein